MKPHNANQQVITRPVGRGVFPLSPGQILSNQRSFDDFVWFDTADPDDGWSYIAAKPQTKLQLQSITGVRLDVFDQSEGMAGNANPIGINGSNVASMPPFRVGWIVGLNYPSIAPKHASHSGVLNYFDVVLAYSHVQKQWHGSAAVRSATLQQMQDEAAEKIKRLIEQIAPAPSGASTFAAPVQRRAVADFSRSEYEHAVNRALEYISAGDIYEVNIAQRFTVPWKQSAASLYYFLREQSPAQFGAFLGSRLQEDGRAICSVSPELFLRVRNREVITCPIKGTRPKTLHAADNSVALVELANSPKERAELNMIIDLERNDLGKVCEYGSVRVVSAGEIEELPTVFHRVATISGKLRAECTPLDLIQAAFPSGSVTGAPKRRAMQIIEELERSPRGPYCGAIGWIDLNGDMDLSIAIRTAVCDEKTGIAVYHAGSGIVADSDPAAEYDETLHKAAAFFRAANASFEPEP